MQRSWVHFFGEFTVFCQDIFGRIPFLTFLSNVLMTCIGYLYCFVISFLLCLEGRVSGFAIWLQFLTNCSWKHTVCKDCVLLENFEIWSPSFFGLTSNKMYSSLLENILGQNNFFVPCHRHPFKVY